MRVHAHIVAAALILALPGCHPVRPTLATSGHQTIELAEIDKLQSSIVQSGDMAALDALLHPGYAVHLPNGRILKRQQTLAIAGTGAFAKEKHRRVQESVVIEGTVGIVMGVDHLEVPPPLATRGERTRRYTNVYVKSEGRWRHLARHFHFVA